MVADLDRSKITAPAVAVNNDPPRIFYSTTPAILLMVQGEPMLNPIEKTNLPSVINTNWDLFFEKSKKTYYLLANTTWLSAWTGGWAAGRSVYGPYGAAGSSAWYNPSTGRYGRSASVQGVYGDRTVASAYNPWTGGYAATSQGHNAYSQWGSSVATRSGEWAQAGHVTTANGTVAGYRTSTGQKGGVVSGANETVVRGSNGVYAGNDGNVYRKDGTGS